MPRRRHNESSVQCVATTSRNPRGGVKSGATPITRVAKMLLAHAQRQPVRGAVYPVLVSVLQRKSIEGGTSAQTQRSLGAELRAPDAAPERQVISLHRHVRHLEAGRGQDDAVGKD